MAPIRKDSSNFSRNAPPTTIYTKSLGDNKTLAISGLNLDFYEKLQAKLAATGVFTAYRIQRLKTQARVSVGESRPAKLQSNSFNRHGEILPSRAMCYAWGYTFECFCPGGDIYVPCDPEFTRACRNRLRFYKLVVVRSKCLKCLAAQRRIDFIAKHRFQGIQEEDIDLVAIQQRQEAHANYLTLEREWITFWKNFEGCWDKINFFRPMNNVRFSQSSVLVSQIGSQMMQDTENYALKHPHPRDRSSRVIEYTGGFVGFYDRYHCTDDRLLREVFRRASPPQPQALYPCYSEYPGT